MAGNTMKEVMESTGLAKIHTAALCGAMACVAVLAALAASPDAGAQDLGVPAPAQAAPVLIIGGTVHTVTDGVIEGGGVLFQDGVISDVLTPEDLAVFDPPAGTEFLAASGKHVYPGLVAVNTAIGLVETSSVRATRDANETGDATPEVRASIALNPDSTLIPVTRAGGVLVVGVLPTGGRVPGRAAAVRLDGWTSEDLAIEQDAALVLDWPAVRVAHRWFIVDSPQDQGEQIRQSLAEIDELFDAAEAYAEMDKAERAEDLRLQAMEPYVDPSVERAQKKPIFVLADDLDEIVSAVTWAAARGYRVTLVGGRDSTMCADLLKTHGVGVALSGVHRLPRRDDSAYDETFSLPARLAELGVPFAMGSSDRDGNVRNLPHEAGLAIRHGLPEEDALRAITLTPAEMLGIGDRYGSIETGKSATLIVTDGDVFEVTTTVRAAFIDGRTVSLETKQTELRDKYMEKYRRLGLIRE